MVETDGYPIAKVLVRSADQMTLVVGSRLYLNAFKYPWGDFAAAAILSGLPIMIVFLMAQRGLVAGLSDGAVKGWRPLTPLPNRGFAAIRSGTVGA